MKKQNRGEFLDRVDAEVHKRESLEKMIYEQYREEYSFQPEVTSRAAAQRSRSVYELSRGDLHKKETTQRILRLRNEQEELANLTFQPKINNLSRESKSVLQILVDPTGFLDRYSTTQKKNEDYRQKVMEEKSQAEFEVCTFKPTTKECPAYVKRIARSLSVVKSARQSSEPISKPQWK